MHACMACLLDLWRWVHCRISGASKVKESCTRDVQNDYILCSGRAVLEQELAWLLLCWPAAASVVRLSA